MHMILCNVVVICFVIVLSSTEGERQNVLFSTKRTTCLWSCTLGFHTMWKINGYFVVSDLDEMCSDSVWERMVET